MSLAIQEGARTKNQPIEESMKSTSPSEKPASRIVRFLRAAILAVILIAIGASLGFCGEL